MAYKPPTITGLVKPCPFNGCSDGSGWFEGCSNGGGTVEPTR